MQEGSSKRYPPSSNCIKRASQGDVDSQYEMARYYEERRLEERIRNVDRENVKNLAKEAKYWFQKAAEGGHIKAKFYLGDYYYRGIGCSQSSDQAFDWTAEAAREGNVNALLQLGKFYRKGIGCHKDLEKALKVYKLAVEKSTSQRQKGWAQEKYKKLKSLIEAQNPKEIKAPLSKPVVEEKAALNQPVKINTAVSSSSLIHAAKSGNVEEVKYLLQKGSIDVNATDGAGDSALGWAVFNQNEPIVALLLKAGADPNAKELAHGTILKCAYKKGNQRIIDLLEHVNNRENSAPSQPVKTKTTITSSSLIHAAKSENVEEVKYLLQRGSIDVNATDGAGDSALGWAVFRQNEAIVALLLKAGADPNAKELAHGTILKCAQKMGNQRILKLLEQANGDSFSSEFKQKLSLKPHHNARESSDDLKEYNSSSSYKNNISISANKSSFFSNANNSNYYSNSGSSYNERSKREAERKEQEARIKAQLKEKEEARIKERQEARAEREERQAARAKFIAERQARRAAQEQQTKAKEMRVRRYMPDSDSDSDDRPASRNHNGPVLVSHPYNRFAEFNVSYSPAPEPSAPFGTFNYDPPEPQYIPEPPHHDGYGTWAEGAW